MSIHIKRLASHTRLGSLVIGLLLVGLLCTAAPARGSGVLYAAPLARGSEDCSSWENACTLQTALTISLSGDEIWAQAGVHKPTTAAGDRSATFTLKTGVGVYGGFGGTETGREQRDWVANLTVLSGDIDGNDTTDPGGVVTTTAAITGTNSYHVVTASGVGSNAVLDGFTITAGQANSHPGSDGGGMLGSYSSLTLANMTFSGNYASHDGGGMANSNCSSLALTNVTFSGNQAGFDGGGLYSNACQDVQVTGATFRDNIADNDGGGMKNYASAPLITNVIFRGNAARYGGGLFNGFNELGSPTLSDVIFSSNRARHGGGMYQYYYSSPTLTNVIFSGNQANEDGGGMYNWNHSSPILTNVTFAGNRAGLDGSAIYNGDGSSPLLQNTIAWNNASGLAGAAIFNYIGYDVSSPTIDYSLVQGCKPDGTWESACGTDGGSNLTDIDPLFVAPVPASSAPTPEGDYRLQNASPVINAGDNAADLDGNGPGTAIISDIPTDLDGNPRIVLAVVDLGAYESQAFPCPAGGVVYVDDDAAGPYTGASWSEAFAALQDALYVSDACEIWVAEGVYHPDEDSRYTEDMRSASFHLKNGVAVYGGFAGTETSREERDWEARVTVLSGDIDGNDSTDPAGVVTTTAGITGTNSYHVVTGGGTDGSAGLDGFFVTAGLAADSTGNGGGMFNSNGSPRLTNLVFCGNQAGRGGGMFNDGASILVNVTFANNLAIDGGGMYNVSRGPSLTDISFASNTAQYGGGMFDVSGSPTLTDVTFCGNSADTFGGGMYAGYSSAVLVNVRFQGNSAAAGGGMADWNSSPKLTNVAFSGNAAIGMVGDGGFGGGLWNSASSPTLANVTFSGNNATYSGGGMYNRASSNPTISNSILWGNSLEQLLNDASSHPFITYSDVPGGCPAGATCTHLLNADPLFVDPAGGDLRLLPGSPAIDAGNNHAITVTTDLAGGPRLVDVPAAPDTGLGTPPLVDMGAYEANFVDAELLKAVSPLAAAPGEPITYTLTFSNGGSISATQVVISDSLPAFLGTPSFLSGGVAVTDTGRLPRYVWSVQDLAAGQGGVITVSGSLTVPLAAGTYTNTAAIGAVRDAAAENDTASVTVVVLNVAPAFTTTPVATATQGTLYTCTAAAEDANGDALTITATVRPAWLTLTDHGDGTATVSGTPANADVGDHAVVLRVSDSGGLTGTQAFTLTVANVNDAPAFISQPVTAAVQGLLYAYSITAADPDLMWGDALTLTFTTRPAWLTLVDHGDGTGNLFGTPANADVGQHPVELWVIDSAGLTGRQAFTVTVANVNDAPSFASTPVVSATQGAPYSYTVVADDPDLLWGDVLTISAPILPGWLTLVDHGDGTATLAGAPANADVGEHAVELRATDGAGLTDGQAFTITVANVNDAPFFTSTAVLTATQDAPYSYTVVAEDPDLAWGDALTISAPILPGWLTLVDHGDGTATLSGTPGHADLGEHAVELWVTDRPGLAGTQIFTVTVWRRVYLPLVMIFGP